MMDLAYNAKMDPAALNRYCREHVRPTLHTVMRLVAVLAPSSERADEIIRSAGYDITYDYDYRCVYYRQIRDYIPGTNDKEASVTQINRWFACVGDAVGINARYTR